MKFLYIIIFLQNALYFDQPDTIAVNDFTDAMVYVDKGGFPTPTIEIAKNNSLGFFLNSVPSGKIKICSDDHLTVWINGRFLQEMDEGCDYLKIDKKEFESYNQPFISLYGKNGLSTLTINEIAVRQVLSVNENQQLDRPIRNQFREYMIAAYLILGLLAGILGMRHSSRISYLLNRTFSFKASSYELINTQFFGESGIFFSFFLSLVIGFFWSYIEINQLSDALLNSLGFWDSLHRWFKISLLIFIVILLKWLFVTLFSSLFRFKRIAEFQLFDFVNVYLVFGLLIIALISVGQLFYLTERKSIVFLFQSAIPMIIGVFIVWYGIKFVNNFPDKKLVIISYLCATEIVPAIVLIGWFFK